MPTLTREHRRLLENTVAEARSIAERGASKVLADQYAVHHHEPWSHMKDSKEDSQEILLKKAAARDLRNRLRAHGRQLGDRRDPRRETQEILHLSQACAYEHWHRMLFARFLAENDLLLDPEHGMAMTLEDVRELSREQGCDWLDLASDLAQRMLLAVFRPDDPVLKVHLPPETRQQLEEKLAALPKEIFQADDSLGWVYQFWQRDAKKKVDEEIKHGVAADADRIPPKTQLFTEDYMVLFLLENTLGAWWTTKRRAECKDARLVGYDWTYLRLNDDGSPAAGSFDGWPRAARDLRVLDPCMGSGHFLVFTLPILMRMRMQEEELSLKEALVATLRENLFGLEIDARCSQIAAFNLALAAWRLAGEHFQLPEMNLACSGLGIHASESDWVRLAGEDYAADQWMRRFYSLFKDAPTLGSLIDPTRFLEKGQEVGLERVLPLIEEVLQREQLDETRELAIAAQGVLAAFRILSSRFTLVATNVPYLGRGKQDPILAQYCGEYHSDAKADLATTFVDRCLRFAREGGSVSLVTPQSWLYQVYYREFLRRLLGTETWQWTVRLGPGAFQEITGEVVKAALVVITRDKPAESHQFASMNASAAKSPVAKAEVLRTDTPSRLNQAKFEPDETKSLRRVARCYQGISTGDNPRMMVRFWEINDFNDWRFFQVPSEKTILIGGRTSVVRTLIMSDSYEQSAVRGREAWGIRGIAIARISSLAAALYHGDLFANTVPVIIPNDEEQLPAIWEFVNSPEFRTAVVGVNQSLSVDNGYLEKIPFDVDYWGAQAMEHYPEGLPQPSSADPTQWLFNGDPKGSDSAIQVAVARLLGYRWPRQTGISFPDCAELNSDRLEKHADANGIVALSSLAGEPSAADRLRDLLADAYGPEWSAARLSKLLGRWASLEVWLRDRFFEEHCQVFDQRPVIWHVWDGRKDGFHALVNYHKLTAPSGEGRQTLEKLIYTFLGDWITRQRAEVALGVEGADARLTASLELKAQLEKILAGDKPYDIFVRWKPLHEQPLGWAPDIDDGMRLNIRPWLTAKPYEPAERKNRRTRGDTCILRVAPRISYGKDKGKEPNRPKEDFPWFWSWDGHTDDFRGGDDFDGARWNDLHYSLAAKQKAREQKQVPETTR